MAADTSHYIRPRIATCRDSPRVCSLNRTGTLRKISPQGYFYVSNEKWMIQQRFTFVLPGTNIQKPYSNCSTESKSRLAPPTNKREPQDFSSRLAVQSSVGAAKLPGLKVLYMQAYFVVHICMQVDDATGISLHFRWYDCAWISEQCQSHNASCT